MIQPSPFRFFREVGSRPVPLLLPSLCQPPSNERLRNQRPTLVLTSDVSTSVREIWIVNVLLLENLLVKFLPAPEPFRRKDAFTINKFKHLRPCLCSLSCTETWQGYGHALTNYHQYYFSYRRFPGDSFVLSTAGSRSGMWRWNWKRIILRETL